MWAIVWMTNDGPSVDGPFETEDEAMDHAYQEWCAYEGVLGGGYDTGSRAEFNEAYETTDEIEGHDVEKGTELVERENAPTTSRPRATRRRERGPRRDAGSAPATQPVGRQDRAARDAEQRGRPTSRRSPIGSQSCGTSLSRTRLSREER